MSCYMVSLATLDVLAQYAALRRISVYARPGTPAYSEMLERFGDDQANLTFRQQETGEILHAQNAASVNCRYNNPGDMGTDAVYTFRPVSLHLTPALVLAQCRHYAYQACETPDYQETLAALIIETIEAEAIRELTDGQPWGIEEELARPPHLPVAVSLSSLIARPRRAS